MGKEVELFRAFVSQKGLRKTPERDQIIEEIFATTDHFDVDGLYLRLRQKGSKVSKASIYRNIPLILECGLIKEVWHEDGHMHYEAFYGQNPHCHLRCLQCGQVIEFFAEDLENTKKRLESQYGYKILDHRLDMSGYCSKCQENL